MAAPLLSAWRWPALAALAAAALLALALTGGRERGLTAFEAAGLMLAIAPERIDQVELSAGGRQWSFKRSAAGWVDAATSAPVPPARAELITTGLRLLHNSAPERFLEPGEAGEPGRYGLAPPALTLLVRGADPTLRFGIAFGARNPLGVARYSQVQGDARIALLPAFVGDTWEQLAGRQ